MGRQNIDDATTVIHSSSIALLQERFRQLEREKEMREEREILKMLKESKWFSTPNKVQHYYEPTRAVFFYPDLLLRPHDHKAAHQVFLSSSLWPNTLITHDHENAEDYYCRVEETPLLMNLWPTDHPPFVRASSSVKFDDYDCDVDTSLHL